MQSLIVTSGQSFTDIDALACAVAYAELLVLEGKKAEVVLPGVFNHSITPTIRGLGFSYKTDPSSNDYKSVIVDVSEPKHVAKCASEDSIVEAFDHRLGFQDLWKSRLGEMAHMDIVGSCGTLIWEEFIKRGFSEKISPISANLLSVAILSNTLNFKAQITNERDVRAMKELEPHTNLPASWIYDYFSEQQAMIISDPISSIKNDTKILDIPNQPPLVFGQMELWESKDLILGHIPEIKVALESFCMPDWFLSSPCIKEGRNYIYTESSLVKDIMTKNFSAVFDGNLGVTDKLWLRKEIRAKLLGL